MITGNKAQINSEYIPVDTKVADHKIVESAEHTCQYEKQSVL